MTSAPGPRQSAATAAWRRPRVRRHAVAGLIVATYLLAAVVVVAVHAVFADPEWLALHLLVLGAATNAVFV